MDKLKLAHEYFLKVISNPSVTLRAEDLQNIQHNAWVYADAMQAEADKRKQYDTMKKVREQEWQPDWSQAPYRATAWKIGEDGIAMWLQSHNNPNQPYVWLSDAPPFNYNGNWKDSLRKRPSNI